jgi:hypothetical protein
MVVRSESEVTAKDQVDFVPKSLFNCFGTQMETLEDRVLKL